MNERSPCKACGLEILWVHTAATNRLMPLDPEPCPDGNIAIVEDRAHVKKGDLFEERAAGLLYKSHFATCPQADKFRRKK